MAALVRRGYFDDLDDADTILILAFNLKTPWHLPEISSML
jgi:hypothetical protein